MYVCVCMRGRGEGLQVFPVLQRNCLVRSLPFSGVARFVHVKQITREEKGKILILVFVLSCFFCLRFRHFSMKKELFYLRDLYKTTLLRVFETVIIFKLRYSFPFVRSCRTKRTDNSCQLYFREMLKERANIFSRHHSPNSRTLNERS